jgi:glycosyltransferase involved in cell wall biosynthesis
VADRVVFPGVIPARDLPGVLAACDVLLVVYRPYEDGSDWFQSPIKLFESLAAGRAVVATRIGQVPEVIRDGHDGLLVDPHDDAGFREAVLRLARDPELRDRLGAEGRRTVEEGYTWEDNVRRALDDRGAAGGV